MVEQQQMSDEEYEQKTFVEDQSILDKLKAASTITNCKHQQSKLYPTSTRTWLVINEDSLLWHPNFL